MPKPLPIIPSLRSNRRYAAPDSRLFRTWFAQKQRKDRKFGWNFRKDPSLLLNFDNTDTSYTIDDVDY